MIFDRRCSANSAALLCLVIILSALVTMPAAYAVELENNTAWTWGSETVKQTDISASPAEDVDGDGDTEIVTGGCYYDGTRFNAQLCVWDGSTLALENVQAWYWTDDTFIYSVAVGDVDGDQSIEIVTGGYYFDGERDNAQLCVWSGSTLALENIKTWYWTAETQIGSVAVGDVDGDSLVEIVTGGYYSDGEHEYSQLTTWTGSTLALENVVTWYWGTDAAIDSVAIGDVDGDQSNEVVTGGSYWNGINRVAQLCVWSGSTLALEDVKTWYWTSHTRILSVAVNDVDADDFMEVVTGGFHYDGARYNAQLCVWSGSDLALEHVTTWYWVGGTVIFQVAISDVDGDDSAEIVTGGYHGNGVHDVAQLCVWSGSTLALEDVKTWYWIHQTRIYCVTAEDVDGDTDVEIVTGGYYSDNVSFYQYAQLAVWGSV